MAKNSSGAGIASETQYTLDEFDSMSLKELQAIAKEAGIDIKGLDKEELIEALSDEELGLLAEDDTAEGEILLEDDEADLEEEIDGEMSLEEAMNLLREDSDTESDSSEFEFEEVTTEVVEGDASFEFDDNNSNNA